MAIGTTKYERIKTSALEFDEHEQGWICRAADNFSLEAGTKQDYSEESMANYVEGMLTQRTSARVEALLQGKCWISLGSETLGSHNKLCHLPT